MKYFEQWAKDKSPLIKEASLLITTYSEPFLEFLKTVKSGDPIKEDIKLPPVKDWLNLYRNHKKVYHGVTSFFRQLNEDTATVINLYEEMLSGIHTFKQVTPSELNDMLSELTTEDQKELLDAVKSRLEEFNGLLLNDSINNGNEIKKLSKDEKRRLKKSRSRPEVIFFLRVWVPCFLLYGEYPPYLLRKARQGDDDALEKLLRLDKSLIYDKKIQAIFHLETVAKKRARMTLITKALQNTPKAKLDIQKIKYLFAGFLSLISIGIGQRPAAAEIHRLFDAVARDMDKGYADSDLIVSPETFEKAIQRARTFWQTIPLPDKK